MNPQMNNDSSTPPASGKKALAWILGAFLGAALLAPHLFNGLTLLGRHVSFLAGLRNLEFESVASRCILIALLLVLRPAMRAAGIRDLASLGYPRGVGGMKEWRKGLGLGLLSLGIMSLLGWVSGAYVVHVDDDFLTVSKCASILIGAVLVGFIEEGLFRGFLFQAFRRSLPLAAAMIVSSLIFSSVHFASPYPPDGTVYGHWNEGLKLLRHLFYGGHDLYHYFPFSLTLFIMGLVLCSFFVRTQRLFFVAGLHAGWVIIMRVTIYTFDRDESVHPVLFGESEIIAKCWATVIMALGLLLFLILRRKTAATPSP